MKKISVAICFCILLSGCCGLCEMQMFLEWGLFGENSNGDYKGNTCNSCHAVTLYEDGNAYVHISDDSMTTEECRQFADEHDYEYLPEGCELCGRCDEIFSTSDLHEIDDGMYCPACTQDIGEQEGIQ